MAALTALPGMAWAQSVTPARGRFLVATPALDGSQFAHTVLLVIRHDNERSIALMINRPTNVSPGTLFPESAPLHDYDGPIYLGGPVAPAVPLLLFRDGEDIEGSVEILRGVRADSDIASLNGRSISELNSKQLRVFVGLAEWGPGQLAAEIAAGGWTVVNATASQVFTESPLDLWGSLRFSGNPEVVRAN